MHPEFIDYDLPAEFIAQRPAERRDASRLLVLPRHSGDVEHRTFHAIGKFLREGDLLVMNDTRVIPARLRARKTTGGAVEVFLLEECEDRRWSALLKPGKAARSEDGFVVELDPETRILCDGRTDEGFSIRFERDGETLDTAAVLALCDDCGETPLPPYIARDDGKDAADLARYQTVYAKHPGAVAAPTAGLHFTESLLADLRSKGIEQAFVTLHVGVDTFRPLTEGQLVSGRLHGERVSIDRENGERILQAREEKRRIVAVGTTTARALESFGASELGLPFVERTQLFIRPGYEFRILDALITNFHLPRSSLLLLVSALSSKERILDAYEAAKRERYRFYSYGDAMLIC
ncbi:MAG: tRNA preQ1(34) S-adenosylmethionine ribosyltransferase-isomerase QueA [Planctomycetota bacterium]